MSAREDAYARHQQARWMRPDAHRWVRPDVMRFLKPGSAPEDVFPGFERKYSPNQPRVPAGNPDGGQWTDGGGLRLGETIGEPRSGANAHASPMGNTDTGDLGEIGNLGLFEITPRERDNTGYTQLAGDIPEGEGPGIGHNQGPPLEPPEIPTVRPNYGGDFMRFIRAGAVWIGRVGRFAPGVDAFLGAVRQLDEGASIASAMTSANDPPKTLDELQERVGMSTDSGYHDHHIVNQHAGNRVLFGDQAIDNKSNQARIPVLKHIEISRWYASSKEEFGGLRPRDYLRDKSWDEQMRVGLDIMRKQGVLK